VPSGGGGRRGPFSLDEQVEVEDQRVERGIDVPSMAFSIGTKPMSTCPFWTASSTSAIRVFGTNTAAA